MKKVGVGIMGLGVVGGGTYKILTDNKEYFKRTQNIDITVESVLEKNKERALSLGVNESRIATNIEDLVSNPNVDIVCEVMGGVEPARTFVIKALLSGKTVVTSNKELFAKCWCELEEVAKENNAGLFYEATCVGGVPIIRTLHESMQGNNIKEIKGIINGTTNYILTKMANEGLNYEDALKQAQELGYAEFNPTADVEGFDAMYKLSILSSLAFKTKITIDNIYREGISKISKKDISIGKEIGYTLKLLAIGKNTDKGVEVRVHPTFISSQNPLAVVNDSFNAVSILGDAVGDIMLYGRGAGALPTGSAIVSDVIFAAKHHDFYYAPFDNTEKGAKVTKYANDFVSKYYLRIAVKDENGIVSKLTSVLDKLNVASVKQVCACDNKSEYIIISNDCKESVVRKAMEKLTALEEVIEVVSCIRIED